MRVLVVTTQAPFVVGGAEAHADNLVSALKKAGHEADLTRIPFTWRSPRKILDQILAVRMLDVTESFGRPVDRVIGLKFPAYCVQHPHKTLWILHQHRAAYDLWDPRGSDTEVNAQIRDSVVRADNRFIPEARRVFANSKTVAARLKRHNGIDSTVLYHPPPAHDLFRPGAYGGYVFLPSKLGIMKRQHLAIEAMQHVGSGIKLVLAGDDLDGAYRSELAALIARLGVEDKVELLGHVHEVDKRRLYSEALAVVYVPYGEDYGYVTLESFLSGKALITCTDSGGPLEFVGHRETGLICEPSPRALADAIESMAAHPEAARRYGQAGLELVQSLHLSWDTVVEALLA